MSGVPKWPHLIVLLREKPMTVTELADLVGSEKDTVRANLRIMKKSGLVKAGLKRVGGVGGPPVVWEWV